MTQERFGDYTIGTSVKSRIVETGILPGQVGTIVDQDNGLEAAVVVRWENGETDYLFLDEIELNT
jgi:hypothetical protein